MCVDFLGGSLHTRTTAEEGGLFAVGVLADPASWFLADKADWSHIIDEIFIFFIKNYFNVVWHLSKFLSEKSDLLNNKCINW